MRLLIIIPGVLSFAIDACTAAPPPAPSVDPKGFTCGRPCNSSIECAGDELRRCRFCSFGACSDSLPEKPAGDDAGVDAGSGDGK